jgi:hypothetical protein
MRRSDFIPRPDAAFNSWAENLCDYVVSMRATWGHIKLDEANGLATDVYKWQQVYKQTLVPHIPQLTAEKNRLRTTTERIIRAFINRYLRWPPVSDLDRDKMGIRHWDTIRPPSPVPTTVPEIEADSSVIRELSLRLRDFGASNWGKPEHVHGMELAWGIMDARPGEISLLPHLETETANPIVLSFEEEERGLRVFFAARWINSTAKGGPWSDIESAIVP